MLLLSPRIPLGRGCSAKLTPLRREHERSGSQHLRVSFVRSGAQSGGFGTSDERCWSPREMCGPGGALDFRSGPGGPTLASQRDVFRGWAPALAAELGSVEALRTRRSPPPRFKSSSSSPICHVADVRCADTSAHRTASQSECRNPVLPATTRRRNRTFQAGGCPALPVLKTGWATRPVPRRW
jgi:hypothetical protein